MLSSFLLSVETKNQEKHQRTYLSPYLKVLDDRYFLVLVFFMLSEHVGGKVLFYLRDNKTCLPFVVDMRLDNREEEGVL